MKENKVKRIGKIPVNQIIRAVIQLLAFIAVPGLFITIFSSIGGIISALAAGTFTFAEYAGQLLLTAAALLVTIIWGRVFCGYICSFGAMQDLLWAIGKHIPVKLRIPEKMDRPMKYFKYAVLAFVAVAVWIFAVFGDAVWSPWTVFGMYSKIGSFAPAEYLFTAGGVLLLLIAIVSLFVERAFCKYFCPLGAIFSLLAKFRIVKLKRTSECGDCRLCTSKCSMSIPLYKRLDSGECINCMKCAAACPRENIGMEKTASASGTLAAAVLAGCYFAGTLPLANDIGLAAQSSAAYIQETEQTGRYKDGTYKGTGKGYRGNITVSVTVSGGVITDITTTSYNDDREFFSKAQSSVIPAIIAAQGTDVQTVSGATFSSRGLIEAVANALGIENESISESEAETSENNTGKVKSKDKIKNRETSTVETTTAPETTVSEEDTTVPETTTTVPETTAETASGKYKDGVYTGTGTGFRGNTEVRVTVENGEIADITITSYADDNKYFSRAQSTIISEIIAAQDINVQTVSGATFSSRGIIEAVASALGIEYTNTNSQFSGGHGGRHGRPFGV